jgi:hypothetical protein
MKKQALSILATLAFIFALGAAAGYAQDRVVAHVPFGFSVGSKNLPSGDYDLVKLSSSYWGIRNGDGSATALTIVSPDNVSAALDGGKLVFKQYGNHYFLYQISREGITVHVPGSRLERELARNGVKPNHVIVAARQ